MKIDELLYEEFTKMCDEQEDCSLCKYGGNFSCQLSFGYSKGRADAIDEELQNFAQWLWDSHYLVDEAFTINLVEQYKDEQLKEEF